jgi:tetratricopeptide (TPR) repeat protein
MPKSILILFILIFVFLAFLPCLKNGWVNWDDQEYVLEDTLIRSFSWHNLQAIFTQPQLDNYHPLSRLSYALEYHFAKFDPFIYHLDNLILHLFNCILVFFLIFLLSKNTPVAFLTAILFGIHPVHVESVAWISERRDVLYTLFFLGSLVSYLKYRQQDYRGYYYLSLGLFLLSLFSKAMGLTLPFILVLIDYYFFDAKSIRKLFKDKAGFFSLAIFFGLVSLAVRIQAGDLLKDRLLSLTQNLSVSGFAILFYLNKIILPFNLSCLYPYTYTDINFFHQTALFTFICLVILLFCYALLTRYSKKIIFGIFFFLITIFPVIQLIPSSGAMSVVFDRYLYLSSVGLFYSFAITLYWLYSGNYKSAKYIRLFIRVSLAAALGVLLILSCLRCLVWKDSLSLWNDVIKKYPGIATAYNSRGAELLVKGEYAKASSDFNQALKIDPSYYEAYFNLGSLYNNLGRYDEAIKFVHQTLQINPTYLKAYDLLIILYGKLGRHSEIIGICQQLIKVRPDYAQAYLNLCSAYGSLGNYKEAIFYCQKALKIDPNLAQGYYNLAIADYYLQQYLPAIKNCDRAIELGLEVNPQFLELLKPHRK